MRWWWVVGEERRSTADYRAWPWRFPRERGGALGWEGMCVCERAGGVAAVEPELTLLEEAALESTGSPGGQRGGLPWGRLIGVQVEGTFPNGAGETAYPVDWCLARMKCAVPGEAVLLGMGKGGVFKRVEVGLKGSLLRWSWCRLVPPQWVS